jgi:hypothetical protein
VLGNKNEFLSFEKFQLVSYIVGNSFCCGEKIIIKVCFYPRLSTTIVRLHIHPHGFSKGAKGRRLLL